MRSIFSQWRMKLSVAESSFRLSSRSAPYDCWLSGQICQQQETRQTFIKSLGTHIDSRSSGRCRTMWALLRNQVNKQRTMSCHTLNDQQKENSSRSIHLLLYFKKEIFYKSWLSVRQYLTNKTKEVAQIPQFPSYSQKSTICHHSKYAVGLHVCRDGRIATGKRLTMYTEMESEPSMIKPIISVEMSAWPLSCICINVDWISSLTVFPRTELNSAAYADVNVTVFNRAWCYN